MLQAIKSTLQALAVVALFSSAYAGEWLALLQEHTVMLEPPALECLWETGTPTVLPEYSHRIAYCARLLRLACARTQLDSSRFGKYPCALSGALQIQTCCWVLQVAS